MINTVFPARSVVKLILEFFQTNQKNSTAQLNSCVYLKELYTHKNQYKLGYMKGFIYRLCVSIVNTWTKHAKTGSGDLSRLPAVVKLYYDVPFGQRVCAGFCFVCKVWNLEFLHMQISYKNLRSTFYVTSFTCLCNTRVIAYRHLMNVSQ